jgi:basic membrane protein A
LRTHVEKKENIVRRARSFRLAGVGLATAAALVLAACGNSSSGGTSSSSAAGSSSAATGGSGDCAPVAAASGAAGTAASSADSSSEAAPTGGPALDVGLAFDTGGRGDGTFNDSAGRGADQAKTDLGVNVTELEAASDDDRTPNLTLLSSEKKNPIVTVGFLWTDTLTTIAGQNPDINYAIVDSTVDLPNVTGLVFAAEQGSFLVGAAAALKTTTCKIGFIGGQEGELIGQFEAGFKAGAKAVRPDIEIQSAYLGPTGDNTAWTSPDKAKTIAKGWYDGGTDIIYSAAGGSGQGTIDAAVEATAAGTQKWAIGVDSDQYLLAQPEQQKVILTSMLKRVDEAVYQYIEAAQQLPAGQITGGVKVYDLSTNGVGYSTEGGYLDDVVPTLEDYKAKIVSGEIKVPTDPAQA